MTATSALKPVVLRRFTERKGDGNTGPGLCLHDGYRSAAVVKAKTIQTGGNQSCAGTKGLAVAAVV